MIHDLLENAAAYYPIAPRIAAALKFLQNTDLSALPLGRSVIDGDKCFAIMQEYMTKTPDKGFWEAHQKYIDVQYIISGIEAMGWAPIQQMTVLEEYNPEKEYAVLQGPGQWVNLSPGAFVIFHPHDAHMGAIAIAHPAQVRKIVIKVAVEG
jgi:YhcH/YjgK/YiaL family protein